jgi:hypothetical protein
VVVVGVPVGKHHRAGTDAPTTAPPIHALIADQEPSEVEPLPMGGSPRQSMLPFPLAQVGQHLLRHLS